MCVCVTQGQPPPAGDGEGGGDQGDHGDQGGDTKQKENTAYAKKIVLRLAGLMGLGGAVGMVYIFGKSIFIVFLSVCGLSFPLSGLFSVSLISPSLISFFACLAFQLSYLTANLRLVSSVTLQQIKVRWKLES